MKKKRHTLARPNAFWLIGLSWLAACGARSQGFEWENGIDDGGSSGSGGSVAVAGRGGMAGKGGMGKAGSVGKGGSAGCDGVSCKLCDYLGVRHVVGETFAAGDGCNTCTCALGGIVSCTAMACNLCLTIENEFSATLDIAKSCNPALDIDQCSSASTRGSLYCGCGTSINAYAVDALTRLLDLTVSYEMAGCATGVICEPCVSPTYAYCSAEGRCTDVF